MSITAFCFSPTQFHYPQRSSYLLSKRKSVTCSLSEKPAPLKDNASKEIQDSVFSSWAEEHGIDMSTLSLTTFPENVRQQGQARRGITAKKAFKTGEDLISVARKTALEVTSLDGTRTRLPGKISQTTWQKLPWYARLALLIINAKKDKGNQLQLWISRLPSSFDTPFHWSDEELAELQSSSLVKAIRDQRKLYRKHYDEINQSAENQLARKMSYAEFVWAVECVRSRAFSGPLEVASFSERLRLFLFVAANTCVWPTLNVIPWDSALNGGLTALFALAMYDIIFPRVMRVVQGVELKRFSMTPGIDFLNHKSVMTGRAEVSFEYFRNKFVVQAGEDYQPGNEVFISYGAQSNDSLLQYYGFVEESNPGETYAFDGQFEKMLGVPEGRLIARRDGFDKLAVSAVTKKVGSDNGAKVALRELCDAELKTLGTTLEEDISVLNEAAGGKNPRLELAVRYRKEKKILLRDVMKLLD